MTLHTPPAHQGQIVEVSYGWADGTLYRRIYDASDRQTSWAYAADEAEVEDYLASGDEPWHEEPAITTWQPCAEPDVDLDRDMRR